MQEIPQSVRAALSVYSVPNTPAPTQRVDTLLISVYRVAFMSGTNSELLCHRSLLMRNY